MPGTPKCAWCRALDTIAAFDLVQCLRCGLHTTFTGEKAVPASQSSEGITVADIPVPEFASEPVPASTEVPVVEPESTPDSAAADAAPTGPVADGT